MLLEILTSETQTLKAQYIEQTSIWAEKEFQKISNITLSSILVEFGYFEGKFSKQYQHTKSSFAKWNKITSIKSKGVECFVQKAIKDAISHYESSLLKLVTKISDKGLIEDKISIKTSHIGVNIDITLTDNIKTVKAFTIIASGEVQKPHYRYLIK